jgi:MYXO-CTERM domain-containing protein
VVTEGNFEKQFWVAWPPACFELELISASGERTTVAEVCTPAPSVAADGGAQTGVEPATKPTSGPGPAPTPPPVASNEHSDRTSLEGDDTSLRNVSKSQGGCTVRPEPTPGTSGHVAWLSVVGLAWGAALRRRK